MTAAKYNAMALHELRRYVLTHREDIEAFQEYIERSKTEGQMISLDLSDDEWETKVKEAIRYSSNAIRWYCYNKEDQSKILEINNWWKGLSGRSVIKNHVTGLEINKESGIWEPRQIDSPIQIIINNPSIEVGDLTASIHYDDQDGYSQRIEIDAVDLDLEKQNLFAWPTAKPAEVIIFSTKNL